MNKRQTKFNQKGKKEYLHNVKEKKTPTVVKESPKYENKNKTMTQIPSLSQFDSF